MEATTKDLRLHTRELISATDRGEQVIITYRGKPRAKLVPLSDAPGSSRKQRNPAFALWAEDHAKGSVDEVVRRMRKPREFD